jgi:hypothetical protein
VIRTQPEQLQGQGFGGNLLYPARREAFSQNQAVGLFADLFEIAWLQLAGPFDFYWMEPLPV